MGSSDLDLFMVVNRGKFRPEQFFLVKKNLQNKSDAELLMIQMKLKNPLMAFILSFFFGWCGVDRFYVSDDNLGFMKIFLIFLFLSALFFYDGQHSQPILTIIVLLVFLFDLFWIVADWFLIMGRAKDKNFQQTFY